MREKGKRKNDVAEGSEQLIRSLDEFIGFLANRSALERGGAIVLATRRQKRRGLLERMAQVEVNGFLRVGIAGRC